MNLLAGLIVIERENINNLNKKSVFYEKPRKIREKNLTFWGFYIQNIHMNLN